MGLKQHISNLANKLIELDSDCAEINYTDNVHLALKHFREQGGPALERALTCAYDHEEILERIDLINLMREVRADLGDYEGRQQECDAADAGLD